MTISQALSTIRLARRMHNSWRKKRIEDKGWHIPEDCTKGGCKDCHTCVNTYDKLTKKEKELALLNSEIAHEYFTFKSK